MERELTREQGIDALEDLAYRIAQVMIDEFNVQAGDEMLRNLKAAQFPQLSATVKDGNPAEQKVRSAGGAAN